MSDIEKVSGKQQVQTEGLTIDFMVYVRRLWMGRIVLLKSVGIGLLLGLIIALSLPKTYKAFALLAPESSQNGNQQLSGMAAMLGLGGMGGQGGRDAISINRAENIISSTPFLIDLMDIRVKTINEKLDTTIVGYMGTQKSPWWNTLISLPGMAIGGIRSLFMDKTTSSKKVQEINPFHLTAEQLGQIVAVGGAIKATTDKKTGMIEISSTFQDPMVAALVTDSVMVQLQKYLVRYRTTKAQQDCDYLENLYEDARLEYYRAQTAYANYTDSNQNIIRKSASTESIRLSNEMNLAYQVYTQLATQLQIARTKLQEDKPSFTVIEPTRVPLVPAGPNKKMIMVGFAFIAFVGSSLWILFGKDLVHYIRENITKD